MLTMATAILSLPLLAGAPTEPVARFSALPFIWDQQRTIERQPGVRLWFRGDNLFRRGDGADIYYRVDDDAYVMIVRIDTDGRLEILSPTGPRDYHMARSGHTYHVPGYSRGSFHVSDDPGMGYVFAVASWEPFDLDRVGYGRSGAYRYAGHRIHGDPFTAVQDLADDLLDDRYGYYAMDHVAYYVDRRYEYPRYLCYDCHGYRSYSHWNPYAYRCVNFRIVIYNDPFYYPYRYSRGSRVIYVRDPRRPRYEFKDAVQVASREPYINYRFRGNELDQRRPGTPANDPRVPVRTNGSSAGATRPGDDVRPGGVGGRRVIGSTDSPSPGPDGRTPRRDGDGPIPEARSPRREIDGGARSNSEGEPRRMPEREPASRADVPASPETRTPRRGDGGSESGEPRREPVRQAEPRRVPEREAEPRRDVEPRREPERRVEPRREPERQPERRVEPVREPERQPERRVEPRREPERRVESSRAAERRSEPRQSSEARKRPAPRQSEAKSSGRSTSRPTTQRRKP